MAKRTDLSGGAVESAAAPDHGRGFERTILDALPSHVAVLDETGAVVWVNRAWQRFGAANAGVEPSLGVGANYLEVCRRASRGGDTLAATILADLQQVLSGALPRFECEYPCHSPDEQRWFSMEAVRTETGRLTLVIHHDITHRKLADQALREAEDHLRHTVELNPQVNWTADPEGNVLHISQRWLTLTGMSHEEALDNGWVKAQHPEDRHSLIAAWSHSVRTGAEFDREHRVRAIDGSYRWMHTRAFPRRDEQGRVVRWYGTTEDVHERRLAQEALQQTAEQARRIIDNTLAFVGVLEPDGTVLEANATALAAGGIAREETVGRKFWDCYWWNYDPALQAQLQSAIRQAARGQIVRYDAVVRMRGETRMAIDFMLAPVLDAAGRVTHLVPSGIDISERKAVEAALKESEERFRAMADGTPLMIWVHDAAGRLQFINHAYQEFFGVTWDQILGDTWRPLVHPDDVQEYVGTFLQCLRERRAFHAQARVQGRDGKWRWVESFGKPRFSATGVFLGIAGSSVDVTERHEFQAELERLVRERTAALHETTDQLNAFVYTLAHDLRAPLRAQLAFATILLEDYAEVLGPTGREYARRIADSAERQGLLLGDLLKHISLSREDIPLSPVDLARVVRQAQADLVMEIQQRSATVHVAQCQGTVLGNEASLHLVLVNLLSNALKFVAPGVQPLVTIRSEILPADPARPGSSPPWLRLAVEDNGIGIHRDHLGKLFQVFQRLNSSSRYPGTGIGLAIVQKAAERMGGRVGVASEPGQGSRFWVDLPTAPSS